MKKRISVYYWFKENELILSSCKFLKLIDNKKRQLGFRPNTVDYLYLGFFEEEF